MMAATEKRHTYLLAQAFIEARKEEQESDRRHTNQLLQAFSIAQAEVDEYDRQEERESRRDVRYYKIGHRRPRYDDDDDCDDYDGDSDDSLSDIYDEIEQLKILASQKPKPYSDANQLVRVEGIPPPGNDCSMDAVFIPEDVDVEYDKDGTAHIHKRQGGGGIIAEVINLPNKSVGQKFPEEAIDACVPIGGEHTFKIEAPKTPPPVVHGASFVHDHGLHQHQHDIVHVHQQPPPNPHGQPGPIIDQNGQMLVPTGRYKVEKVVKRSRKPRTLFDKMFR